MTEEWKAYLIMYHLRNSCDFIAPRAVVYLLTLSLLIGLGLGESIDRGCLASGKSYLARYHDLIAEASRKPVTSISAIVKGSNLLNFSSYTVHEDYRSDTAVRRLVEEFLSEAFHQNATFDESARVVGRVNDIYSKNIAKVGLPRFFGALRIALSNCTGDP